MSAVLLGTSSFAATYVGNAASGDCNISNVSGSKDCELWSGNDSGNKGLTADDELFSISGWTEAAKYDVDDAEMSTYLDDFSFTLEFTDGKSGEYSIDFGDTGVNPENVFISLKGSTSFAAYLLNDDVTAGTYYTGDLINNGGNVSDLSHISVWYNGDGGVSPVPLPAGLPLAMLGLSALGFAGIRRKKS
ncbi:VPLPA-CTERM sorting domain-containing protein [Paracoccaceae bacterium GXU_MW_L88]